MTKDEMKNRISMALKDPMLQQGFEIICKENAELKDVIKLLITTLNDTTWDEGHPCYSDGEPHYHCPECSCKDCYRVSCKFNESELFKKLYKEFPELYENYKEIKEND